MTSIFPIATTIHPFLSVLFYIALIFTNSKSAFLGAVAVMIIMAYFFRKQKKVLLKFFIPTIVATLLLGTQWIQNISPANTTLWQAAIKIVTARPLIGTGPDTFGQSYFWVRPKAHNQIPDWDLIYNKPNNQYLQVATGSGILGLTTYIAIIASVIYVFKKIKKDKLSILIFSGWIGVIVANFFSSVSSTSQLTFYLFPAMLIAQGLPQKEGKHLKKRFVTLIFGLIALAVFFLVILGASLMADVYYTHGRKLNSQSKPNEAISYLQKAINLSPHNSLFWEETALAHEQIISDNNMKAANEYSKSAVLLSPYNTNLLKSRAGILTKIAKAEPSYNKELEEVLMRLMLLAPTDPSVYLMSGIYYANINNPTLAYELLNKALNLKSDYTRARIALASLLVNYGKNDDAKKELNIILEYDSNNQYVQELLKTIK
jgi:O-antigen ligase